MDGSLVDTFMMAAGMIAGGAVALTTLASTLFYCRQQQEVLVTRFGKHIRTVQDPGIKAKVPFIDKIAARIGTDTQQVTETLKTKTKDDLFVGLPIAIQFQVVDAPRYYFMNRDPIANMGKAVSAAVRTATAGKEFQELYGDRDGISNAVIDHIKDTVGTYGINISKIIIDEPTAPNEVQNAFNEVRASERLKEAARNKAEAHKIEIVAKAEAEKQADELRGAGKAGFRKAIFDQYSEQMDKLAAGGSREEAINVMMQAMHQDTLRDVGDKGNMVIVIPSSDVSGSGKTFADMATFSKVLEKVGQHGSAGGTATGSAPALN